MTPQEMHVIILNELRELKPDFEMHKLHKAILIECCENALQPHNSEKYSNDVLLFSALQAFEVSNSMMNGLIKGAINLGDVININYRDQTFVLDRDSSIVKHALKLNPKEIQQ
jgi:hypothetical protein